MEKEYIKEAMIALELAKISYGDRQAQLIDTAISLLEKAYLGLRGKLL